MEHLTHSHQNLDGSLAINLSVWSPSLNLDSLQFLHHLAERTKLGSALRFSVFFSSSWIEAGALFSEKKKVN